MSGGGGGRHHPLIERVGYYLARARAWWRRATLLALLLRVLVWLAGTGALLVAASAGVLPLSLELILLVAMVLAVPAAVAPHTRAVSMLQVLALGLFGGGLVIASADRPMLWWAGAVGGLLYLHHAGAALAAQLRTDTVVPWGVLRYGAARVGLVLAVSAGVGGFVAALPAPAGGAFGYLALGAAAVLALTGALMWLARHRSPARRVDHDLKSS